MSNNIAPKRGGVQFQPGQSGNPAGRPKGSRNAFSSIFIGDLQASWAEHGPDVLARVARSDPARYLGVAASVIPKDVAIAIEQRSGPLSEQDLAVFQAIREAIPDANNRPASEVLEHVLSALRAHSGRVIEHDTPTTHDTKLLSDKD